MKNKLPLVLLSFIPMVLASCGEVIKYEEHLDDYVYEMTYRDGFNILQLTDIHWNNNSSTMASKIYLEKVIDEAARHAGKIDLVELTGDLFMLANSYHIDTFLDFIEKKASQYDFRYATIWGNHDHHCLYNPNLLSKRFAEAPHSIHIDPNDDLYGRSNFVINLKSGGQTKWQIANLDSGASFSETALSPFRDYDYIRKDQTAWWLKEHEKVGDTVPGIAYYHIPQDENRKAWEDVSEGATYKNRFFKLEGFGDNGGEEYASDFLDVASQHNLKAAFMGHAHNVDWTVDYPFDNGHKVTIGLGVKTGGELYYAHIKKDSEDPDMQKGMDSVNIHEDFDLIGASLVSLKNEGGDFDLEHLYLNERANEDFIRWVTY